MLNCNELICKWVFWVGVFLSTACSSYNQINKSEYKVIPVNVATAQAEDSTLLQLINPYKNQLDSAMNTVIAYSEMVLSKDNPEGLLNNFITDLVLKKSNEYIRKFGDYQVDVCLLNSGGLRASLPQGPITKSKVYELMPFENELVAATIKGKDMEKLCNFVARKNGMPIAGCKMGIKDTLAVNVMIGKNAFDINKNYTVVTSDYLFNGGDNITFFTEPVKTFDLSVKVREAIIEYLMEENAKGRKISAKLDQRIYYAK